MTEVSVGTPLLWFGFTVFVAFLLALDLGVFHRKAHEVQVPEALAWSIFWTMLALAFNGLVVYWFGKKSGLEFLTGYIIERSLSFDNLFVFLLIFNYFGVAVKFQHRALVWGIVGAALTRGIFILGGAWLIHMFHWVIYVFGGFLIFAAWKLVRDEEVEVHPEKNLVLKMARRFLPVDADYSGSDLWIRKAGVFFFTPIFLVILVIEASDVVFAFDSIPAIFAVTRDPFIVYTSNIFAILGLRALYFLLAGVMKKFHYLNVGLAAVLAFVGVKMLIADFYEIPILLSLGVVGGILGIAFLASLPKRN